MIIAETKIVDIHSLIKVIVCVNEVGGQIWWRGHPDVDYKIWPSVFRPRENNVDYNEIQINSRFRQKAPALRENVPGKDEWFEWLFLMQHYRLPTRLLDWTESPLIACYFAVNNENENEKCADGALFALNPFCLNYHQTRIYGLLTPQDNPQLKIARRAFREDVSGDYKVLAILPDLIDQRMIAQLSVFTIHDDNEPLECHENSSKFLVKYEIPVCAKEKLREQLKHAGIRPSSLFPDLEHLSKEIKDILKFKPQDEYKEFNTERLRNACSSVQPNASEPLTNVFHINTQPPEKQNGFQTAAST